MHHSAGRSLTEKQKRLHVPGTACQRQRVSVPPVPAQTGGDQTAFPAQEDLVKYNLFLPSGSSYLVASLQPFDLTMGSNLKVIFLFLWLLHYGGKKVLFFFFPFCLLARLFILEHFQLLSFANFQSSPLGICTLLLFLSFRHFKAQRESP